MGFNLFLFNPPDGGNPYAHEPNRFPAGIEKLSPGARDKVLLDLALDGIHKHPRVYLEHCLWRLGYLLSPVAQFPLVTSLQAHGLAAATVFFFCARWLTVFARLAAGARMDRERLALLLAVTLWYLFHALINASIRNRIPSDPWVALLALSLLAQSIR